MNKLFILILSCFLFCSPALALKLGGKEVKESINRNGQQLILNGAGIRSKFFFKIYVAGFYLPEKMDSAKKILQTLPPWRMAMYFTYTVSEKKLRNAWVDGIKSNTTTEKFHRFKSKMVQFNQFFTTAKDGDVIYLDYQDDKLNVTINDKLSGTLQGRDFAEAVLAIWLGDKPVTQRLKNQLLGN